MTSPERMIQQSALERHVLWKGNSEDVYKIEFFKQTFSTFQRTKEIEVFFLFYSDTKSTDLTSPQNAKPSNNPEPPKPDQTEPMDFSPTFSSQSSSLRPTCENPADISDCLSKFRAVSEGNK